MANIKLKIKPGHGLNYALDLSVSDMKRKHNELVEDGRRLYERLEQMAESVNALRESIKRVAPDDHDEVMLLFSGVYDIEE